MYKKKQSLRARQRTTTTQFHFINTKGQNEKSIVPIYVISCAHREDRRKEFRQEWNGTHIPFEFFIVQKDVENPKRGCWTSHQQLWKHAIQKGHSKIIVLEDDATFQIPSLENTSVNTSACTGACANVIFPTTSWNPAQWKPIPQDWCMAYLGGTAHWLNMNAVEESAMWDGQKPVWKQNTPQWIRAVCWTTSSYMVSLQGEHVRKFLQESWQDGREIDRYFKETIHPYYPTYCITPTCIYQKDDFSDIENSVMNYAQMAWSIWGCPKPAMKPNDEGHLVIKMAENVINRPFEQIPKVSIITPTFGRPKFFPWVLWNIAQQMYPMTHVEWLIIEEEHAQSMERAWTQNEIIDMWNKFKGDTNNTEPLPDIRWIHVPFRHQEPEHVPEWVGVKRNKGIQEATHDIILHFDDDDYYPPWSIVSRVNALVSYPWAGVVGMSTLPCINVMNEKSFWMTDGRYSLSEASMGYRKKFALQQPFSTDLQRGEYVGFMQNRWIECLDISGATIVFPLKWKHHTDNSTGNSAGNIVNNESNEDFIQWCDTDALEMMRKMEKFVSFDSV